MRDNPAFIKACKALDPLALRELYNNYRAMMLGVCLRYTGNRQQAEDLVHEAYEKVFKNIKKFKPVNNGSIGGWMKRIAINTSINHLKKQAFFEDINEAQAEIEGEEEAFGTGKESIDAGEFNKNKIDKELIRQTDFSQEDFLETLNEIPAHFSIVFNLHIISS